MTLKTLLLGSATAFAVVGGAQAADLSIAEPVDYVRICDAFGTGYYYIPGTDTCLKIGGFVKFKVNFHVLTDMDPGVAVHQSTWDFQTEAGANFTAKSMTEWGELGGNLAIIGNYNPLAANSGAVTLDGASLWWGPIKFGHFGSVYDGGGGYADSVYRSDVSSEQIALSWSAAGFGLALGIEDPRTRWGSELGTTYSVPNIVAAATISQGMFDAKAAVGFAQVGIGSVYGVGGHITLKLDSIAAGDAIRFGGAFGTGASFVDSSTGAVVAGSSAARNGNNNWSAYATFQHFFTSALSIAASYGYRTNGVVNGWQGGAHLVWTPVPGFKGKFKAQYAVDGAAAGVWTAQASAERSF